MENHTREQFLDFIRGTIKGVTMLFSSPEHWTDSRKVRNILKLYQSLKVYPQDELSTETSQTTVIRHVEHKLKLCELSAISGHLFNAVVNWIKIANVFTWHGNTRIDICNVRIDFEHGGHITVRGSQPRKVKVDYRRGMPMFRLVLPNRRPRKGTELVVDRYVPGQEHLTVMLSHPPTATVGSMVILHVTWDGPEDADESRRCDNSQADDSGHPRRAES